MKFQNLARSPDDRWTVLESENSWNLSLQESCFRAEHRHPFQAMMSMRTDHQAAYWLIDGYRNVRCGGHVLRYQRRRTNSKQLHLPKLIKDYEDRTNPQVQQVWMRDSRLVTGTGDLYKYI